MDWAVGLCWKWARLGCGPWRKVLSSSNNTGKGTTKNLKPEGSLLPPLLHLLPPLASSPISSSSLLLPSFSSSSISNSPNSLLLIPSLLAL